MVQTGSVREPSGVFPVCPSPRVPFPLSLWHGARTEERGRKGRDGWGRDWDLSCCFDLSYPVRSVFMEERR